MAADRNWPTEAMAGHLHQTVRSAPRLVGDAIAGRPGALLRAVTDLLPVASIRHHGVVLAAVAPDESGCGFRLRGNEGMSDPAAGEPGAFPFGADVPRDPRLLLVTVLVGMGQGPEVRLDYFAYGLHEGFVAGEAAIVSIASDGSPSFGYAHRGVDFTDLVLDPVRSLGAVVPGARGWAASELFPAPVHNALRRLGEAAEDRGETMVLSSDQHPGIHAVRPSGESSYRLIGDSELVSRSAEWERGGEAVCRIRQLERDGISECRFVRRVAGLVHGPGTACPGVCVSRVARGGGTPAVEIRRFDRGQQGGGALERLIITTFPRAPG